MYTAEFEPLKTKIAVNDIEGALREEIRILRRLVEQLTEGTDEDISFATGGGHWALEALETLDAVVGR